MFPAIIFLSLVVLVFASISINYYYPKWLGKIGESAVKKELSRLPLEYKVLNDVVFKTRRGTTQIDHIVISKYGVFAIETKNYRGKIYGDDDKQEWKQIILTEVTFRKKWWRTYTYVTKNVLYNPVKQSIGHAYEIKRQCPEFPSLYVIPIVVFTGRADLCGVRSKYDVVDIGSLKGTIMKYREVRYNDSTVNVILDHLVQNNVRELVSNREHVKNVRKAKSHSDNKIASGVCPQCGGQLVRRQGRYGTFVGCSNYPKCRFVIND